MHGVARSHSIKSCAYKNNWKSGFFGVALVGTVLWMSPVLAHWLGSEEYDVCRFIRELCQAFDESHGRSCAKNRFASETR